MPNWFIKSVFVFAFLCLLSFGESYPAKAQTPDIQSLVLGKPIERELKGDEAHSYSLALQAGQFLDLVIEQKGIDVVVTLFDPNNKKVAEVDSPNGTQGAEPLSMIIETTGNYRLEVRSLGKTAPAGRYEAKIVKLRAATEKDKNKIAADKVFAEGETLRSQGTTESFIGAIKKYEEALPFYRVVGDKVGEAATLNNIGGVYGALGEPARAIEYFQQAVPPIKASGNKKIEAYTLYNIGAMNSRFGEHQKALEYYNQALALMKAVGDRQAEVMAINDIAAVYNSLGEQNTALEYSNQALSLSKMLGNKLYEANALNNIGLVYSELGEKQKAFEYYNQALALMRAVGNKQLEANTLHNIGLIYSELGEKQKALEYYNQSLALRDKSKWGVPLTLNNMGLVYSDLGDTKKALEYYNQALPLWKGLGDKYGEARTLHNIGVVYYKLSDMQKALEYYTQVLTLRKAVGNIRGEALTLSNMGSVYDELGDKQRALDYYNKALILDKAVGNKSDEAQTLENVMGVWIFLTNPRFAVFYGKLSVNDYQQLRSFNHGIDKELQKTFLKSVEGTYRSLASLLIEQERFAEAQQVLNLFKDQQYFDFKSDKQPAPLALTEREISLAAGFDKKLEVTVTTIRQINEIKRAVGSKTPTSDQAMQLKALDSKLATANGDYQAFLKSAEKEFAAPPTEKDKVPTIADLGTMQAALRETSAATKQKTVAVYTLVGEDNYRALVVTPDDVFSISTPIKGAELNQKALQLWKLLRTPKYDPQPLANELYKIVFAPLADKLPKDTKTILWSLDGNLRYIPMGALYNGKKYLVESYNNVVFTRADKERLVRARNINASGTGMGSSEEHTVELAGAKFNAAALPAVKNELGRIFKQNNAKNGVLKGDVLLDSQFTRPAMLSTLQKRNPLVHIASHFKFEPGNEARSFLLLGDGSPFTLDQMKTQKDLFAGVDLLTLSACQTAAQRPDANGREVDGFAELAQRLGAGAVMASLWEVSDNSTAELMARFYKGYVKDGLNKADAIRRAQLALLHGDYKAGVSDTRQLVQEEAEIDKKIKIDPAKLIPFKQKKGAPFAHPYYWSPFILIGNWK